MHLRQTVTHLLLCAMLGCTLTITGCAQRGNPAQNLSQRWMQANYWLLAAGCWLLAAGCWLLAAGCWAIGMMHPNINSSLQRTYKLWRNRDVCALWCSRWQNLTTAPRGWPIPIDHKPLHFGFENTLNKVPR
jgi:hypothetical protein